MNKKDLLEETIIKALHNKASLNEVYIKEDVETFDDLYDSSWGPAIEVLDKIAENGLEKELMNWLEDLGTEDAPIDRIELNDYIAFQVEDIFEALGLDENGDPLDESKKLEARSHKEDNEKAAPRTTINQNGREVKTRTMVDVSNPKVGNNSYHNENGNQYWGTTEAEYASKRNKTGKKNEFGDDVYLADRDTINTPVSDYQYNKNQAELLKPHLDNVSDKAKRARNPYNKAHWETSKANLERNIDDYNKAAQNVIDKEKDRIANKKTESAEDTDTKNIQAIQDVLKKSGITNERTLDLMSKDILNDLQKNYTKGCKDEYGNYYETVITDAFRKKIQQITGKMPDLKIGENKKITEGLSQERAEELIINAIESVINKSDEDIEKMLKALGISKSELIEIGYDEEGSKNLLDMVDKINQ